MHPIIRTYRLMVTAAKAFVMSWARSTATNWASGVSRTRIDYAGQVGDGRANSIVVACLAWGARVMPEAPIQVVRVNADGESETVHGHPLTKLLARPNPYYSGALLIGATWSDFKAVGNAYWIVARSAAGRPVEVWWVPASLMEPQWPDDGSAFISHYEYTPNGVPKRIEEADVIHFRNGVDPANPRKGLSEIASLVREVATDDEAALWTASLLRNVATPTVILAPDDDVTLDQAGADQIKASFEQKTGGDNRGRPIVLSAKVRTTVLSFNPQQMDLKALRRIPEERISAVMGIPAIVVGLGTGLDHATMANFAEARMAAYESAIIPTQRLFAEELTTQLLPMLGNAATERVEFDVSRVRALQPDLDKLHTRLDVAVRGGWMTPNEARSRVGLDALTAGGDVLYVPVSAVPTLPEDLGAPIALPEPSPIRALPAPKGRDTSRDIKGRSAQNFADALERIRARNQAPMARDLARLLDAQRARVVAAVSASAKAHDAGDVFDVDAEAARLRKALDRWYTRVLESVRGVTEDALGVAFDLDDPATRAYLAEAGKLIRAITEHTRDDIMTALAAGQAEGEGVIALAKRIQEMTAFNRERATMIALTELGHSSNLAAMTSYEASGVVHGVEIFDGDGCGLLTHDGEPKAHGLKFTLAEFKRRGIPMLAHPRCRRAIGAIVDASEFEAAA